MFKRTPCYDCTRPERLPNCLCQKDCKIHADYQAEKTAYYKKRDIEIGLDNYICKVSDRNKKAAKNHRRFGGQE